MTKLAEIDACVECPHYIEKDADEFLSVGDLCYVGYIPFCCVEEKNIEEYEGDFPAWCPLKDVEKEKL